MSPSIGSSPVSRPLRTLGGEVKKTGARDTGSDDLAPKRDDDPKEGANPHQLWRRLSVDGRPPSPKRVKVEPATAGRGEAEPAAARPASEALPAPRGSVEGAETAAEEIEMVRSPTHRGIDEAATGGEPPPPPSTMSEFNDARAGLVAQLRSAKDHDSEMRLLSELVCLGDRRPVDKRAAAEAFNAARSDLSARAADFAGPRLRRTDGRDLASRLDAATEQRYYDAQSVSAGEIAKSATAALVSGAFTGFAPAVWSAAGNIGAAFAGQDVPLASPATNLAATNTAPLVVGSVHTIPSVAADDHRRKNGVQVNFGAAGVTEKYWPADHAQEVERRAQALKDGASGVVECLAEHGWRRADWEKAPGDAPGFIDGLDEGGRARVRQAIERFEKRREEAAEAQDNLVMAELALDRHAKGDTYGWMVRTARSGVNSAIGIARHWSPTAVLYGRVGWAALSGSAQVGAAAVDERLRDGHKRKELLLSGFNIFLEKTEDGRAPRRQIRLGKPADQADVDEAVLRKTMLWSEQSLVAEVRQRLAGDYQPRPGETDARRQIELMDNYDYASLKPDDLLPRTWRADNESRFVNLVTGNKDSLAYTNVVKKYADGDLKVQWNQRFPELWPGLVFGQGLWSSAPGFIGAGISHVGGDGAWMYSAIGQGSASAMSFAASGWASYLRHMNVGRKFNERALQKEAEKGGADTVDARAELEGTRARESQAHAAFMQPLRSIENAATHWGDIRPEGKKAHEAADLAFDDTRAVARLSERLMGVLRRTDSIPAAGPSGAGG